MQRTSDEAVARARRHAFRHPAGDSPAGLPHRPDAAGRHLLHRAERGPGHPAGHMWWSVPKGITEFCTWRERTTVYHEGVPGHHLQVAQTMYRSNLLNRWRRIASWVSGHGGAACLAQLRIVRGQNFGEGVHRVGGLPFVACIEPERGEPPDHEATASLCPGSYADIASIGDPVRANRLGRRAEFDVTLSI